MRFRQATESDVAAIAATCTGHNALPLEPRVRAALPGLLRQLIASPACTLPVFEVGDASGVHIVSFASGLFIRDTVVEQYLAEPHPALLSSVLAGLLDGRQPLLTIEEIRQRNSIGDLTLAVFPIPYGTLEWDDPLVVALRNQAPQAFLRFYAGYRLRAIYYEVFTDAAAAYVLAGGYRLLHDFSTRAGTGFLGKESRSRMLRLTRAELPPGAMSMATQMFDPPPAQLGLTPAEQRVVLHALDGASDRELAEALGLSNETIHSTWHSIYHRLTWELPEIEDLAHHGEGATRGHEKRRIVIAYLRQNMHELRPLPHLPRRSGDAGTRGR